MISIYIEEVYFLFVNIILIAISFSTVRKVFVNLN